MNVWNRLTDAFNKPMAIDEMQKKYNNTYLILQTSQPSLVMYKGFSDGMHQFVDELGVRITLSPDSEYDLYCKFPERQLFNHRGQVYEFIRRPNRQYRRGVCRDNCMIYSPVRRLYSGGSVDWDMKFLWAALYPQYPANCAEAIELLKSESVAAIALNEKFFISHSLTRESSVYFLWFSNVLIGEFHKEVFTIKHKNFQQEVLDNLKLFVPYSVTVEE